MTLEDKQAQFHEFFTIKHTLKVNMRALGNEFTAPAPDDLDNLMPEAFRIANEVSNIELQSLRPIRSLGEQASQLVEFLNHQARKIDLIMSLVLQQQDSPDSQFIANEFGGGGLILQAQQA